MKRLYFFMAILAITAVSIRSYGQTLRPSIGPDGKVGFVDEAGNQKVPFMYDSA